MASSRTKVLVMCAVCVALAFLLNKLTLFRMPMGGSVTPCSMFFIALAGLWFGPVYGILTGVTMGLLDLVTGGYIMHPFQVLLDYPLAFGALGLAGFFGKMKYGMQIGLIVGALGRFVMVFLSGIIFYASSAPAGQHPALYSAAYNISYIGVEVLLTLVIISVPAFNAAIRQIPEKLKI